MAIAEYAPVPPSFPAICPHHKTPQFVYQLLGSDWRTSRGSRSSNCRHRFRALLRRRRCRHSVLTVARRQRSDVRDTVTTRWPCDAIVMSKIEVSTETAAPSVAIHVGHYDNQDREYSKLLDVHVPTPNITPSGQMRKVKSFSDTHRLRDVTTASGATSARSLRPYEHVTPYPEGSESGTTQYGAPSVRSLASIGMGCTDGRKMVIRRVPTSPTELFHLVRPPTWVPLRMKHPLTCHYSIDLTRYRLYGYLNDCPYSL